MQILLIILIPIFLGLALVTLFINAFLFKAPLKTKRIFAIVILSFSLISNTLVIYQLKLAYDASALCRLSPDCMDESGMLYIIYYGLLFFGALLTISGLIKTIRAFVKKTIKSQNSEGKSLAQTRKQ